MSEYSDLTTVAIKRLTEAGWYKGRDVFDDLLIDGNKKIFPAIQEIMSEFGLLKITYQGKKQEESIYLEIDNSEISKNLRADTFGFESYLSPEIINEPDFEETENFQLTNIVENQIGRNCSRVGFIEDEMGADIYVDEAGSIYLAHHDAPVRVSNSFIEFLNLRILK